jgi:MFS family permease
LTEYSSRQPRYYGWYIAATLAVTETISWGIIYYAFSVFLTPMEAELGWTRTEMTGAFSLALLIAGATAFPIGTWIDRRGARLLMTVGSVGASLLVLAWSQVHDLPSLYLIWVGLGLCAAAVLYEPAFAVIAVWFVRHRGRALALVTFAAGLASTIFVPLSDALLRSFGWRDALVILAVLLAVTTIPLHLLVLRRHPHDLGLSPDGDYKDGTPLSQQPIGINLQMALRSRSFWMLTAAFSLASLSAAAIRFHLIPFMIAAGFDASTAAVAAGSIGILQVTGRVIFAPLDSRISIRVMAGSIFALEALAIFVLLLGSSAWNVIVFILIFGSSYGAKTLVRPSMLAAFYGSSHFARISSIMAIFLTITTTAAPVGASFVYDRFGTYQPVLIAIFCISLVATGVMIFIKPYQAFQNANTF